ncbi:MAG: RNA 2'-phosphotransferase [bacterium]
MGDVDKTKISRKLSYILRHDPGELYIDPFGWVYVEDLCDELDISPDDIIDIVHTNDKKRFILSDDESKIRCVQGHTINIKLELEQGVPPTVLYHGTSPKYLKSIKDSGGLSRMSRHHVHLSKDKETAIDVGQRHSKHERPVILEIDAKGMYRDGYKFFVSENGVWLTDEVPNKYIKY